jgi:hypothetical protein
MPLRCTLQLPDASPCALLHDRAACWLPLLVLLLTGGGRRLCRATADASIRRQSRVI